MLTCLFRENADIRIRSAVTKEGEIVGREAIVLMDCGAYGGEQMFLTTMTAHTLGGNYRLGAVRLATARFTPTPRLMAHFAACNGVYNTFALERHTDEIAQRSAWILWNSADATCSATAIAAQPAKCSRATCLSPMLDRMSELCRANPASKHARRRGRLYGPAMAVGTWFVFVGPSAATVTSMPTAARRW